MCYVEGENTKIKTPVDIAFDSDNEELYVLDRSNEEILVFPLEASGDAHPTKILRSKDIFRPYSLRFDQKSKELSVINSDHKRVIVKNKN